MKIISGEFGGRTVKTTSGPGYRPAMAKVRQALFSMLESRGVYWPECKVLDLFAGSGALAFEALSRGAERAWFVEKNKDAYRLIAKNAETFGVAQSRYQVMGDEVKNVLTRKPPHQFDVIFIDPPYGFNFLTPTMHNVLKFRWLAEGGIIVAEVEAKLALPQEAEHPQLDLLVNRAYGQTRILVWSAKSE